MKYFQSFSIRNKMITIILSIVLLSIIAGFSINIIREYRTLKSTLINESMMTAKLVSEYCLTPLDFGYPDEAEANLSKLESIAFVFNGCVFDEAGELFASYSREDEVSIHFIPDVEFYHKIDGKWLHVFRKIKFKDEIKGTIYLRVSTSSLFSGVHSHLFSMTIIGLGMMLLAYILSVKMQKIISEPILALADVTGEIAKKNDYSLRVEKQCNDEVGVLSDSFNKMLLQLEIREKERDEAEQALRASYQIINRSPAVAFLWRNEKGWPVEYTSESVKNIFGYTAEEFIKGEVVYRDIIYSEDLEFVSEEVERYISKKDKNEFTQEYRIVTKDKRVIWIDDRTFIRRNDAGQVTHFEGLILDVTDRKKAEEAVKKSEVQYRLLAENITDVVWVRDFDLNLTYVSPSIEFKSGYSAEEILNSRIENLMPPESVEITHRLLNNEILIENEESTISHRSITYEIEMYRKDGTRYPAENTVSFIRDQDGKATGLIGVNRDITDRKKIEIELLREKQFLQEAIDSIPGVFYVFPLTENSKMLRWNKTFETITGYTPDEIADMYPLQFIKKSEHKILEIKMNEVLMKGESSVDTIFITKNGVNIPMLMTGKLLVIDGIPHDIGVGLDIADLKKTEHDLQKARNYIENIINSMPSVLVGVDVDSRITQWNREAELVTGLAKDQAVGQPLYTAIPHLSLEMKRVKDAMKSRVVQANLKRARQEDGRTLYEDITVYPLTANGIEGAVIRIDDITEKVNLEEMMIQSEKMLSVGGLAAGMAHEINNPLAGMMQTANVMSNRLGSGTKLKANLKAAEDAGTSMEAIDRFMQLRGIPRMLKTINDSGKRVATIVNNMLNFARKSESVVTSNDIVQILDKTLELASTDYDLKRNYDFKTIKIVKQYDDNLPLIPCEEAKIQQVFLNILRNGAQAMQEENRRLKMINGKLKKPCFTLRLLEDEGKEMIRIEIENNGPVIEKKNRKRVFEPFFTTKKVGVGTGLGLSVSYFIITEDHGGEMSVESSADKGVKFIIKLPKNVII